MPFFTIRMNENQNYDFLAIGDVVVDAFIKLKTAHVHKKLDEIPEELCVRFGDKIEYDSVDVLNAVGNSPNAAVSASRLGLHSALISTIGDDQNGKDCIASLEHDGVATNFIKTDNRFPTNYHYVLWYGVERTILVKHAPFAYTSVADVPNVKWIYLSSLGEHALHLHDEVVSYIASHPDTKLAFQPGTFQIELGTEKLKAVYQNTELFFCNVEEAQRILQTTEADHKKLMEGLAALGPKNVVMTDGYNGAYARDINGACWFMTIYPHTPFERTGAGDSFASTVTSCLALGKTLAEALTWAPINAMSVTQYVGAQKGLLPREKLEEFLSNAPADYVVKEI